MILDELDTMRMVRDKKLSLARYGDGEIRMMTHGLPRHNQPAHKTLIRELRRVISSDHRKTRCLIAVPRVEDGYTNIPDPRGRKCFRKLLDGKVGRQYNKYIRIDRIYGSAFVSRSDNANLGNDFWQTAKSIWDGKRLLTVTGDHFTMQEYGDFMAGAKIVDHVSVPSSDAWGSRSKIYKEIFRITERATIDMVIISAGIFATVLAYHLSLAGLQALDIGKMGRGYLDGDYKSHKRGGEPW
jgi:hypothetical protein